MAVTLRTPPWLVAQALVLMLAAGASLTGQPVPPTTTRDDDWTAHAQTTIVEQWHGTFPAPYSGSNSLNPAREDKHTATLTLFLGRQVWKGAAVFYNPEFSQGTGVSNTVGVAGFPNGEATRAGANSPEYNTARLFLRQTIGLGGAQEQVDADQNELGGAQDVNRVTFTLGKISAVDVFDTNRYSHDPRTQFLNWALMDNGAWDYPADVKGYTIGATAELNQANRALRLGVFMEPVGANERPLDTHLRNARGQVLEWEERYTIAGHPGAIRTLVFWNRAHMGSYRAALRGSATDVTATRADREKTGAGLNWEQEVAAGIGVFARAGFNDGRNETWAFTEIDRTLSAGASMGGDRWSRQNDVLGVAMLTNGLSGPHRRYLAAGGYGFIVGDGRLAYAPEQILESYYSWKIVRWFSATLDYQWIRHPGYNADRGPVSLFAIRGHWEL
jgi:high affinity Mn2+ porin